MDGRTRDASMVLHLWIEPHDRVLRGRVVVVGTEHESVAIGIEGILGVVREQLVAMERVGTTDLDP